MKSIKLIACDIGGTLITDNNTITEENIKAFEYAKSKGVFISLATARMYSSTKYISNRIGADYGVFGNGSHIMDIKNMNSLKKSTMEHSVAEGIIKYAKKKGIYVHLNEEFCETSDQLDFFALKHTLLNKNYDKDLKSNILLVDDLLDYITADNEIFKVLLVSENYLDEEIDDIKSIIAGNKVFLTEYFKNLDEKAINKKINYAEFGCSSDTKADGIMGLGEFLDISRDEIMVIGDQDNDIDMLERFDFSVAMNNGTENAKESAYYVTRNDNNNSGVAEAIYEFIQ